MHGIPLNSVSNSFFYDIVRFKIEVGVEEKFRCKNVYKKQMQHVQCDSSDNAAAVPAATLAAAQSTPAKCHETKSPV